MRLNYEMMIIGQRIELVPYREKFVPNYHEWMKSPFLLEMTGSEPLSLVEEYEMQQSWRDDAKKCTFIILAKGEENSNELDRMVGDINLFLSVDEHEKKQAEIDVMIAEEKYRHKGMGLEAVCLMMWYGVNELKIAKFFAKIKSENHSSRSLFQK